MENQIKKNKISFSKNEKILRIICFIGIALCEIIAVLLLFLGKYAFASIILVSCIVSSFLVSSFFTKKIKQLFGQNKHKKVIYALFYALIIIICMVTTIIICFNIGYSINDLSPVCIDHTHALIKKDNVNISNIESEIFECFEVGDSYYYAVETEYDLKSDVGTVSKQYKITYVKINKYTKSTENLDFISYENAKTYIE